MGPKIRKEPDARRVIDDSVITSRQQRRREEDASEANDARVRSRQDATYSEIRRLVRRAASLLGGDIPPREEYFLWYLLRVPATEWLPPRDWPLPEGMKRVSGELLVHRVLVLVSELRALRPDAPHAEVHQAVAGAPWKRRGGTPSDGLAPSAGVFSLFLQEMGARPTDKAFGALVFDMAAHATRHNRSRLTRGKRAAGVRGWLKARDRHLALERLAHARLMFEWWCATDPRNLRKRVGSWRTVGNSA